MKKLVIFDLDGTLINSIKDLGVATNYALKVNGFPEHHIDSYPMMVGNGVAKLIERALPEDCRNQQTIEKVRIDFKQYYDNHNTVYTRPYEGMGELLESLTEKGIKIAVASNKYETAVKEIVRQLFPNINFSKISGQLEGIPVKPDPSIVFSILSETEATKIETLYVGDSGVDMETANRAGVESIGVTWGFRSREELVAKNANHIVNKPIDILNFIGN